MKGPCVSSRHRPVRSRLSPIDFEPVRSITGRFPEASLREVAVVRARELDRTADASGKTHVWLALEALQVTGSFKVRGALVALDRIRRLRPGAEIVAASAGNHGAGVAYAAHVLGLEGDRVRARDVPRAKRAPHRALTARSIVLAATDHYDDAEARARRSPPDSGRSLPLGLRRRRRRRRQRRLARLRDRRAPWAGSPTLVLAPFGGGGLATGLAWASRARRERAADGTRRVWGVQSEASRGDGAVARAGRGRRTRLEPRRGHAGRRARGGNLAPARFARARERDRRRRRRHARREIADGDGATRTESMGLVLEGSAAAALAPVLAGLPGGRSLRAGDGGGSGRRPHRPQRRSRATLAARGRASSVAEARATP